MKKEKEEKRKPKYGLFSCIGYVYSFMWKHQRKLALAAILSVPVSVAMAAVGLWAPPAIISALEKGGAFSDVALVIIGVTLAELLLGVINNVISIKNENSEHYLLLHLMYDRAEYLLSRDRYLEYDPKVKESDERAHAAVRNNHTRGVHFPVDTAVMLANILKFLLFGAVVSQLNVYIFLLIVAGCAVNYLASKREREKNYDTRDERNLLDKKILYTAWTVPNDAKYGKDIRLYNLADYLRELGRRLCMQHTDSARTLEKRSIATALISFLTVLVRDGAAYAFLIVKAMRGEIDAASFVLYFSAVTSLSEFMSSILYSVSGFQEGALQISDYRESFDIKGRLNMGEGVSLPGGSFEIEFKNVSYKYPAGEKNILENISFKIKAGEKIALVGLNGAGKTTLTKLMCGLLLPDKGEVLICGHTPFEYNRDEMYSLFGLVPQDASILPVSIARNITCTAEGEEIDEEKLRRSIETAGLFEKIASLPKGADTPLNRQVNFDGIDLSGGEVQKLLLARAMYREPKCLILDEPTAALDPIAEDRMYRRYNEITENATSIFISHRLASTRFCDRIFMLDGAHFAEEGTHDELMSAGGKYKELFDIQSKYYREGDGSDEAE